MRPHTRDVERVIVIEQHSAGVGVFFVGLGLGVAMALLLAPQSGEDTRRGISRRAQDAGGTARRRAQGLVDDVSAGVSGQLDRARDAVELKRHQVQRAVEAGRVAAAQARADLERRITETKAAYQAGARASSNGTPAGAPRAELPAPRPGVAAGGLPGGVAPRGYAPRDDDAHEG